MCPALEADSLPSEPRGKSIIIMIMVILESKITADGDFSHEIKIMRRSSSIPGLGRSPVEGNVNPLQYSWLGIPMDRGAWGATVHGVAKSWTWLSN